MYRLRLLLVVIACWFAKRGSMLDPYEMSFRVIPFLDTNVSRLFSQTYAAFAALGRWHMILSSELGPVAMRSKWYPVTTAETITFRRSIRNFEPVRLRTEIVGWNEQCFFLKQTFMVRDDVRAIAYSEGIVRSPSGHLKPEAAFRVFGEHRQSPEIPAEIHEWHTMQDRLRR